MISPSLHDKYSNYHYCIVRECKNTSIKTPGKLWIRVPSEINMRNTWLKLAKRDPDSLSVETKMYFCEDHFDVLLGPLPAGFLRADGATDTVDADYQAALALQQQLCGATVPAAGPPLTARLSITIAQAKLSKNYGLTRMDPYVRLRVGHCIYETHTDPSGGRTPRWNKVIHCLLPPGVNSIYLEIFDECSFTMDELIAWAHITIPPSVLQGETYDNWFSLNGKQGDGKEGAINLVLSYSVGPAAMATFPPMLVVPSTGMGYAAMPMYSQPQPLAHPQQMQQLPQHVPPPPITAEQLQQIQEMFPSMDKEVIKSVLEANGGNKDATINSLLQMSE